MALPNVFTTEVEETLIARINQLTPETRPQWGKMSVSQMLAHCCVSYEYVFEEDKYKKPNFFMGLILKAFVKGNIVNEQPYKQGLPTAPDFIIKDDRDFGHEKQRLVGFVRKTRQMGESYFDGKPSHSFGVLNKTEWNNMFYKHLDHHLKQFGA